MDLVRILLTVLSNLFLHDLDSRVVFKNRI